MTCTDDDSKLEISSVILFFRFGFLFSGNIEPIPAILQRVIDHFIQWHLLPEYKRPNGCIINFFEEVNFLPLVVVILVL
jgi:hypothetical protein